MKKILSIFVKFPFYGKMVIAFMILIGGLSMTSMKKSSFPQTESHTLVVSVAYPGAAAKEMEEGVTTLIENSIRGIAGIKEFSSKSQENMASVTIELTTDHDPDEVLSDIKNAVDSISNFPSGAEKPVVSKMRTATPAMFITIKGDVDPLALKDYAQIVEDDFYNSGTISQINIFGFSDVEISIEAKEDMLRRYGLTFDDLQYAVAQNNNDITGGTIRHEQEEIMVLSRYRSTDPEDIGDIIVRANQSGSVIRISDVATVNYQLSETPNAIYDNGQRSAMIRVDKLNEEDLQEISDFVNQYIEKFNATHADVELRIIHDFLQVVNTQLDILYQNGLLGIILVIFTLTFFLSFRLSLWVAWGIPSAFLGMFIVANLMGITLNMFSLFGMILIIGILVDDGIVIGENIFSHFEKGKSPRWAAIDGTLEVLPAVLTSVSTTIVAFMPLLFLQGNMEIMLEMAVVVILALGFSLAEGIFVLPGHLANPKVLHKSEKGNTSKKLRARIDRGIIAFRERIYIRLLKTLLRHKGITITVVVAFLIITAGLLGGRVIEFTFFPAMTEQRFEINLALKPGTTQEITKSFLDQLEKDVWTAAAALQQEHGIEQPIINKTSVLIGSAWEGTETGTHAGRVMIFLDDDLNETGISSNDVKRRVALQVGQIPEAYKFSVGASSRWGAPVSISLMSLDLAELEKAKTMLQNELGKLTSLYNITDNSQLGNQEINLQLKPKAYRLGLTQSSLMTQVRQAYYGGQAQRMQEGRDEIRVYVRLPLEDRRTVGQLEQMKIITSQGEYPLVKLANFEMGRSPVAINHWNGQREIRVDAYTKDANESVPPIIAEINASILPKIQAEYAGVSFSYQGQQKDTNESMADMILLFSLAIMVILMIIMIHFRSFGQGMLIIAMIPLGWLGSIWGHGIQGHPISLFSLWGMVAVSGTVINDAVVFLSKYNRNLVEGMSVYDAIIDSGRQRFRPILLTTLTTTFGLMPLMWETNPEAQMLVPMTIALAYGILIGTMFILTLFPVMIMQFNGLKRRWSWLVKGEHVSAEAVEMAVYNHEIEELVEHNAVTVQK